MKNNLIIVMLMIFACLFTYDVMVFPQDGSKSLMLCESGVESARFTKEEAKLIINCSKDNLYIRCDTNPEFCNLVKSQSISIAATNVVRLSILGDYAILDAEIDGAKVSYAQKVEERLALARINSKIYAALIWFVFVGYIFLRRWHNGG